MSFEIVPEPTFWIVAAAFFAVCIWLEFRSRSRRKVLRIFLITISVLSLMALYLKPNYEKKAPSQSFLISTKGTPDELITQLGKQGYNIHDNIKSFKEAIQSFNIDTIIVSGRGLEKWDLSQLEGGFGFIPDTSKIEGFNDFSTSSLRVEKSGSLELQYHFNEETTLSISGVGFSNIGDRIVYGSGKIKVPVIPIISGDLLLNITALKGGDTLAKEVVPISVQVEASENILLMSGAPSFEANFLKRYLLDQGYGVAERFQISKDQFRESFSNMDALVIKRLNADILKEFSLLAIDDMAYSELTGFEKRNLNDAMQKGELTLMWLGSGDQPFVKIEETNNQPINFAGTKVNLQVSSWNPKQSNTVKFRDETVAWVSEKGIGRLVVPNIGNSYKLVLSGNNEIYEALWTSILDQIRPLDIRSSDLEMTGLAYQHYPTQLLLKVSDPTAVVEIEGVRVPLEQEWYLDNSYQLKCWPSVVGWNDVEVDDLLVGRFYAFQDGQWSLKKRSDLIKLNQVESEQRGGDASAIVLIKSPISPWLFFFTFLLAMGGLWLEQRLY